MSIYYRYREIQPEALSNAIICAESSITWAPERAKFEKEQSKGRMPVHGSYKQLTIIRDKQGNYSDAIRLSREALEQGWDGDWEKRIARYEKKLSK